MGFFSRLFSSPSPAEPGPDAGLEALMAYGKQRLFEGQAGPAVQAFTRAIAAAPDEPLPLAYRSWAGRVKDKAQAIRDAEQAVDLDPSCAEAHLSLALAHLTGHASFEEAGLPLQEGRRRLPADADGGVLSIGVFLVVFETIANMQEDGDGLRFEFKSTPLRDAADRMLSGHPKVARATFQKIFDSGVEVLGALGLAASAWAMGDKAAARTSAERLAGHGALKDAGLLEAIRLFRA